MVTEYFDDGFKALTGYSSMRWQRRLFSDHFVEGVLPSTVSIPTGLGKTAVMAIWLIALAQQMREGKKPLLPRRLVYVVDRRAVVDQATAFAEALRENLGKAEAKELAGALGLADGEKLPISTLRGQFVDNREWLEDPAKPAIIVGTVDMIGSRLLFEGYGVSRKMRPYHAGLLGADALVLLDEAHLVPPFEALLADIAAGTDRYGAKDDTLAALVPKFQLLPLSATGRRPTAMPFVLEQDDFDEVKEPLAHQRLFAQKHLTLQELGDRRLEEALAQQAWNLSDEGKKPVRVVVFCNSRDVAEKVKDGLKAKAKKTSTPQDRIELFVGARRVRERTGAQARLQTLGFLADDGADRTQPSFLVATSAGEVGVDLDADHMVCDLVAWERMVQRFGRVNRRGGEGREAEIVVIDEGEPKPKKSEQPTVDEQTRIRIYRTVQQLLANLCEAGKAEISVSPESLRQLSERAASDATLTQHIIAASSSAPLRPALNRALVDAWAMTSLSEHTGRPEVAPWLRGWVDEDPQTAVAWRKFLPVRAQPAVSKKEIEDYFEAAPLHASEMIEAESWRVFGWLKKRAVKLAAKKGDAQVLKAGDVIAMLLKADGSLVRSLALSDLLGDTKNNDVKRRHEDIFRNLYGNSLVLAARFGGLVDGLLKDDADDAPPTADDGNEWMESGDDKPVIRFRVSEQSSDDNEPAEDDWRESLRFDLHRNADGEATRWLSIQKWRDTSNNENDRAAGRPQALAEHQSWAAERAATLGQRLGLPGEYIRVLCMAARLHDEGKRAKCWQRAFRAERDAKKLGISVPLAKTRGPINQQVLGGYRHEFGSLLYAQNDGELKNLSPDTQDLVLHLISAHHGFARPLIATDGCEDAPPSVLEERAREVALRYARLQKRWGPWGLAWWESLLRAADAQASKANDERGGV